MLAYASASCLHICKHDANKFKCCHASKHNTDTCKHMLGNDPTTSGLIFLTFGSTGSDLVPVSCVCMMKLGTCIGLALACMGLHMQIHARIGACICTCISQKSLHDFLAWYLHGICMVFALYLHGAGSRQCELGGGGGSQPLGTRLPNLGDLAAQNRPKGLATPSDALTGAAASAVP